MELIDEYKDGEEDKVIYWLGDKPKGHEIGLKATVDFHCKDIELMEEDAKGKEMNHVLMGFWELKDLQTIIEERK